METIIEGQKECYEKQRIESWKSQGYLGEKNIWTVFLEWVGFLRWRWKKEHRSKRKAIKGWKYMTVLGFYQ